MPKFINKSNQNKIKKVLKDTFSNSKIPSNITKLKIGDLKEWDSLGNFNLLLGIEEEFKIKFNMSEISKLKSIKEIFKHLEKKTK